MKDWVGNEITAGMIIQRWSYEQSHISFGGLMLIDLSGEEPTSRMIYEPPVEERPFKWKLKEEWLIEEDPLTGVLYCTWEGKTMLGLTKYREPLAFQKMYEKLYPMSFLCIKEKALTP